MREGYPEAEKWIRTAIEADKRNGIYWYLAKDYVTYAELLKRKGNRIDGKQKLIKAIEIYKKCGADGWMDRYEKELATP